MSIEETSVDLKITGKLSYSDKISVAQAAQIVTFLNSSTAGSAGLALTNELGSIGPTSTATSSNPRHALDLSHAKTNSEKIVALALHAMQQGGKSTFTLEDVRPLFRQARESAPANFSRDLDVAIRTGWVAQSDSKGEYYITERASNVLETGFDSVRSGRNNGSKPRASGPKRQRKANPEVPAALAGLEFSPAIDGYLNYHKVKLKMDKMLWAVNAAKLQGVGALTNQEVTWLTDKLGDGIAARDISTNFRLNFKKGHLNRSTQDDRIRITLAGEDYLTSMSKTDSNET